jgi:kanamycin nucleotidyltransferase
LSVQADRGFESHPLRHRPSRIFHIKNSMKGIKKYTHRDREGIVREMVPLITKKFGDNLVALAAQASFARGDDSDYSDLELIAFVKKVPGGKKELGMSRIRDGILVELTCITRETYISRMKEVTKDWYIAGSDALSPIINVEFIAELNDFQVADLEAKCLRQAVRQWPEVQESTAKALNAIRQENRENLPFLVFYLLKDMLVSLSFLNTTPYITMARFISQARSFPLKPTAFDDLLDFIALGDYRDLNQLEKLLVAVFEGFENIFEDLGCTLYQDNVDPNTGNDG